MNIHAFKSNFIQILKKHAVITAIGLSAFICGCNTMGGAGADIEEAGKSIERAAG